MGGTEAEIRVSLISKSGGTEWSAWNRANSLSEEGRESPDTHWSGGYVAHRDGLENLHKRKISFVWLQLKQDSSVVPLIFSHYNDSVIPSLPSEYRSEFLPI
jgi:hypothetical protein